MKNYYVLLHFTCVPYVRLGLNLNGESHVMSLLIYEVTNSKIY